MKLTNKEILEKTVTIIDFIENTLDIKDPIELLAVFKCATSTIDSIINVKMQEEVINSIKERNNPPIVNNFPVKYRNGGN